MEKYTKYINKKELPLILTNLGLLYRDSNPEEAKKFLMKSLSYKEFTNTYEWLAEIAYDEGKPDEAYHYWKRALTIQDATPKDNVIHNLIEYDIERGKTDSICEMVTQIIAIRDSIDAKLKNDTIKDLEKYIAENRDTDEEIFIIGGGMIYQAFLPFTKTLYLTEVDATAPRRRRIFPCFWQNKVFP